MIEPITTNYFKGTKKYFKGTSYYCTSEFSSISQIDILIAKLVTTQTQRSAERNNRLAFVLCIFNARYSQELLLLSIGFVFTSHTLFQNNIKKNQEKTSKKNIITITMFIGIVINGVNITIFIFYGYCYYYYYYYYYYYS